MRFPAVGRYVCVCVCVGMVPRVLVLGVRARVVRCEGDVSGRVYCRGKVCAGRVSGMVVLGVGAKIPAVW